MKLNHFEKFLMNSPMRWATQRFMDVPLLRGMGGSLSGGVALEMGCGRGVGLGFIRDHFQAGRVDGFDLDPEMIKLARARTRNLFPKPRLWIGDATAVAVPDASYHAVFDFGIIHHVPNWRDAISEAHRILRPQGRLFVFEVLSGFVLNPVWRVLMEHPTEDRFDHDQFLEELSRQGFQILGSRKIMDQFGWFAARKI